MDNLLIDVGHNVERKWGWVICGLVPHKVLICFGENVGFLPTNCPHFLCPAKVKQHPTFFREFWPGPLPRSRLHVCRAQTQQRLSRSPFCRPRSPGRRCRRRQSERQRNGRVVLTFLSLLRRPFLRSIICGRRRSPVVISRFPLNYRAERRAGGRAASKV